MKFIKIRQTKTQDDSWTPFWNIEFPNTSEIWNGKILFPEKLAKCQGFDFAVQTQTAFGGAATQTAFGTPTSQTQPTFGLNVAQTAAAPAGGFRLGAKSIATTTTPSLFGSQPTLNFNKPTGFATPTVQTGLFATPASTTGGLQIGK